MTEKAPSASTSFIQWFCYCLCPNRSGNDIISIDNSKEPFPPCGCGNCSRDCVFLQIKKYGVFYYWRTVYPQENTRTGDKFLLIYAAKSVASKEISLAVQSFENNQDIRHVSKLQPKSKEEIDNIVKFLEENGALKFIDENYSEEPTD